MTEIENRITNLLDPNQSYVVALSGGVDSSVLLHIVHSYTSNVRSVFVNHNQKDSDKLQKSAETIAKDLDIDHLNLDTHLDSDSSETKMRDEAIFIIDMPLVLITTNSEFPDSWPTVNIAPIKQDKGIISYK